jgi:hypothetical protein
VEVEASEASGIEWYRTNPLVIEVKGIESWKGQGV